MGSRPSLLVCASLALLAIAPALASDSGGQAAAEAERARASYRAGDHFGAIGQAQRALALDPRSPAALAFEAQLIRDSQGPEAALALFEQALLRTPDDIDLLGEYAATLAESGRNRDMLRIVRRISELDPANRRASFLQAVLAARAGKDEIARRLLWLAREEDDPSPAELLLDAVLELRSGSPAQAVEELDTLVRQQPDNLAAQTLLGRALLANGEANEVVARLAQAADRGDASPYLLMIVGRAYEEMDRRAEAAPYLDRATRPAPAGAWALPGADAEAGAGDPLDPRIAVARLRALLAQGNIAEANAVAARLAARYPGSADIARVVGDVQLLTGQTAEALSSYRRASAVRSDALLVQRMALLERLSGGEAAARVLLARRLRLNPRERSTALLLADLDARRGDWRSAASLLDYASRTGGRDPRLLAAMAQARLALGDTGAALAAARQAHGLQRGNGAVATALTRTLAAAGSAPELAAR